jgi:hypothetical protein
MRRRFSGTGRLRLTFVPPSLQALASLNSSVTKSVTLSGNEPFNTAEGPFAFGSYRGYEQGINRGSDT